MLACSWRVWGEDRKRSVRVLVALVVADKAWLVGMVSFCCDTVVVSACVALVEQDVLGKCAP